MQTTALARIFSQNIQRSRAVGCHAISSLIIVVACSFISGARGESVFPLVRIRDQVVSVISAPSVPKSPMIRLETCLPPNETSLLLLKKRFLETPAIPTSTIRLPNIRHPIYPPPFSSRSIAFRSSDEWQDFSKLKISLFSTLVPTSSVSPCLEPFFHHLPIITHPLFTERCVSIPLGGLSEDCADRMAALLAYEAMQEGAENPIDPKWRPSLAHLVANPPDNIDADAIYQLLLAGFEGVDDESRMQLAEAWAIHHDGGRYAGDITYASLRAIFHAGNYRSIYHRAKNIAENHPDFAVRAMLLSVLADAYVMENARAKKTLDNLKIVYANSSEYPEILYMEAWLALENFRKGEAEVILYRILHDYPSSSAARKASQILEAL